MKTQVALIMMVFVLCASAGASTASLDDTLVADEVGLYAYPPALSPAGLDDTLVADEVAQYAAAPAPSPTGLDASLVADEAAQYASTPVPSGGLEGAFMQADDFGLYAPAPEPISTGLDDTLLAVEAAQLDEFSPIAAVAPAPSTDLDDTLVAADNEVAISATAPSPSETESIQKIIDIEGCIYEIITYANYNVGEEEKVAPACCKVVEDIVNKRYWPNIFPFNPAFPSKMKGYCAQYAGSPALAPTASYAPADGPAYAPDQGDWMYSVV